LLKQKRDAISNGVSLFYFPHDTRLRARTALMLETNVPREKQARGKPPMDSALERNQKRARNQQLDNSKTLAVLFAILYLIALTPENLNHLRNIATSA